MDRSPQRGFQDLLFTTKEVEEMDKVLEDRKGSCPTRDVVKSLVEKFNAARGKAGNIHVQAKQVLGWLNERRRMWKGKSVLVSDTALTPSGGPSKIATVNVGELLSEWEQVDASELEFEARSSKDGAWYDVQSFRKHRILKSGDKSLHPCLLFTSSVGLGGAIGGK